MEDYVKTLKEIIACYKNVETSKAIDCTKEIETIQKAIEDIENITYRI